MLSLPDSLRAEARRIADAAGKLPFGQERASLFAYANGLTDSATAIEVGHLQAKDPIAAMLHKAC